MQILILIGMAILILGFLSYHRIPLLPATGIIVITNGILFFLTEPSNTLLRFCLVLYPCFVILLNIIPLRRALISRFLFSAFKQSAPQMSDTERTAIEAGTTWFEAELFAGKPNLDRFLLEQQSTLTTEEQAFLAGPCEQVCAMVDDWQVTHITHDLPEAVWQFLKTQGFFGLMIPKGYQGLGFSNLAHSEILAKLASRSLTLSTTVAVPNSLGPGELILHYGTEAQKSYYLPRLAKGLEIPCFALTSPEAGSDASAIPDIGIVVRQMVDGKASLGISLTWNKRYITLAPVATLLGLAFRLFDPDRLLGEQEDLGITCALIPVTTPGVHIGKRHLPLNTPFQNGPTHGKNVFITLDCLIGGPAMAGKGWRMLMECLSSGRAISLPASVAGTSKMGAYTTGAYARLRVQFKQSLSAFEGIKEALARIANFTYIIEAARLVTVKSLDAGQRPSVLTAILKYHATEFARLIANDAMDIHAGKGIMMGPSNYLANAVQGVPIAITVEGANILTRCLMIFGQGAIRCHPFILKELQTLALAEKEGAAAFDKLIFAHLGFSISHFARTLFFSFTQGRLISSRLPRTHKRIVQNLTRASSAFALTADMTMALVGAKLKFKESLSARLGDAFSDLYLCTTVLKHFENQGRPEADLPYLYWSTQYLLHRFWLALEGLFDNYPNRMMGFILKKICMPFGLPIQVPSDAENAACAALITSPHESRDRLCSHIYVGTANQDPIAILNEALQLTVLAEPAMQRLKLALKHFNVRFPGRRYALQAAFEAKFIKKEDFDLLSTLEALREKVEAVDAFEKDAL